MRFLSIMVAISALTAGLSAAGSLSPVKMDPPPGWTDVTDERPHADVFVVLQGPKTSSFILTRVKRVDLANRSEVRTLLVDIMAGINKRTSLGFELKSNLRTKVLRTGITVHYISADLDGKPRLILGLLEAGGLTLLGTLTSSIPETLFTSIFGGLSEMPGFVASSPSSVRVGMSTDRQLSFSLPNGFTLRRVTAKEKKRGFVAAIIGKDAELVVVKVNESVGKGSQEWNLIKQMVLGMNGVDAATATEPKIVKSAAGPTAVVSSADMVDEGGKSRFMAAFMPWCYWGYTFLGKGPAAEDLFSQVLGSLRLGPAAVPKLVSATPRLKRPRKVQKKHFLGFAAAGAALAFTVLMFILFMPRGKTVNTGGGSG